ncbi:MAG: CesT family type III secretion system chaperone [Sulfitobacter sp.]|nr:CesT family type III secretion system chaperone [Sulfitobacter sp.]
MSRRDFASSIVEQWCEEIGLTGVKADAQGRLSLTFEETIVTFAHREQPVETVAIYIDLGTMPKNGAGVPEMLLSLNLQTWLSNNMTIGLDPDSDRAIGWNTIPVSQLSISTLREVTEAMLTTAMSIKEALDRPGFAAEAATRNQDAPPDPFNPGMTRV